VVLCPTNKSIEKAVFVLGASTRMPLVSMKFCCYKCGR
jgi:hypothetical protein